MPPEPEEPLLREIRIDGLSHGPAAVGRDAAGVVFVSGGAPGDRLRVRVTREREGHAEAEIDEILEAGPDRREAPCPYLPECGGCTWQHVGIDAQRAAKLTNLRDQLERIGHLDLDAIEIRTLRSTDEWGYRHRVTLRVDDQRRLGFYRHRSHDLVEIEDCRIANAAVNRCLPAAREWLAGTKTIVRRVQIAVGHDGAALFVGNAEGPFESDGLHHERFLAAHPEVRGIVLFGRGWRFSFGDPRIADSRGLVTRGAFTQVNDEGNEALLEAVMDFADPQPTDRVLDLYCGAGNISLPLARRAADVLGIDGDSAAIEDGRENARRASLHHAILEKRNAERAVAGFAETGETFDVVVLDPPRSGAATVIQHLPAVALRRIVYVSCNPATLARDLGSLAEQGWRTTALQPIDLFPQTHHLEVVAQIEAP